MAEELKNFDSTIQTFNKNTKEVEAVKKKSEIAAQFSLTTNQLMEEMSRALCEITYTTKNWYDEEVECCRFYLRDFDEQFAYAVDRQNDYIDVKIPYSMSGDNVSFEMEGIKRIKYVPTDWEGEMNSADIDEDDVMDNFTLAIIDEGKNEFSRAINEKSTLEHKLSEKEDAILSINEKFTAIQSELNEKVSELEQFKQFKLEYEESIRKERIDALFTRFSKQLTKEEIEQFRAKEMEMGSVDEFEKELKAFVCDKIVSESNIQPQVFSRMGIPPQAQQTSNTESDNVWERLGNNK